MMTMNMPFLRWKGTLVLGVALMGFTLRSIFTCFSDDLLAPENIEDFLVADQKLELHRKKQQQHSKEKEEPPVPAFVQERHNCIQSIRKRHQETLGSLIDDFVTKNPNTAGHLLVDPAYHENFGDVMLTFGEQSFFQNAGVYVEECLYTRARPEIMLPDCQPMMHFGSGSKLAFWHAGGNWGDLYQAQQAIRLPSMETLLKHNFTVVGMPQSLYYKDPQKSQRDAQILKTAIANGLGVSSLLDHNVAANSRVTLTWREQASYDRALQLYPFVKNVLVPDIALQLGPFRPIRNNPELRVDILFFFRTDRESVLSREALDTLLNGGGLTYRIVDWKDRHSLFANGEEIGDHFDVSLAIRLLSLGTVVVVDRLHAALLSYLSGLPLVYLDQTSGKLTKTLSVALNSDSCSAQSAQWVVKAKDLQDAVTKATDLLKRTKQVETIGE